MGFPPSAQPGRSGAALNVEYGLENDDGRSHARFPACSAPAAHTGPTFRLQGPIMRYYGYGNFYFSSIQQGIQAQHALGRMVTAAHTSEPLIRPALEAWLGQHETTILLNGGDHDALVALHAAWRGVQRLHPGLPVAVFREPGVNNAVSSVGVVLPEEVYDRPMDLLRATAAMTAGPIETASFLDLSAPERLALLDTWERPQAGVVLPWTVRAAALLVGYGLAR